MSKGSGNRTLDYESYRANWEAIFGREEPGWKTCQGCGVQYQEYQDGGKGKQYEGLCFMCYAEAVSDE